MRGINLTAELNLPQLQTQRDPSGAQTMWQPRLARRKSLDIVLKSVVLLATLCAIFALIYLLHTIAGQGIEGLSWEFLDRFPSRFAHKAGIKSALYGSAYIALLTAVFAVPLGIGTAVYLEEFAADTRLRRMIDLNISNLAGVPSIVYGMLGLAVFVRTLGMGRSLLAGALTMALLILPIIVVAAREALKGVPTGVRYAALALGATRWQTVRSHVLPAAMPGILTGVILAMARAAGETAPLILIGALNFVAFTPEGPLDSFTVLPIQIYNWASRPQEEFHAIAASGIIVLLSLLILTNAVAILLRQRFQRRLPW